MAPANNELFGDDPTGENGSVPAVPKASAKNGKAVKIASPRPAATVAAEASSVALADDEPLTDPFASLTNGETLRAESSSEPSGAAPLMAAPTSPEMYAAPVLPERITQARTGQNAQSMFAGEGLTFERKYTKAGGDVFDTVEWELRTAAISGEKGEVVFEQKDCEIPKPWSMLATNVVVSKYFRGKVGTPGRERSVKQLVSRVADTIFNWGKQANYFATDADADTFHDELKYLLLHQHMAFNSPVWFNLGVPGERPQVSACQPYHAPVSTPQGLIPIGRLVEENAVGTTIYDAHGTTRIVATKANGRKQVLRLHTKSGYSLDVTGDHLVWKKTSGGNGGSMTGGRFVEAGTVQVGDRLLWHRTPLAGKSEENSREEAEAALAGWLQCDGFVGQYANGTNRSLTIEAMVVNADEEAWVRAALARVFPEVHSHTRLVETKSVDLDCKRIRLYGEVLRPFVEKWNIAPRGTDIQVPPALFTAPYAVAAAYLRSVFQAEGYVILRDNAAIGLDMISEDMVHGLQKLLLRFGIYSRVRFKADSRNDRKGCWSIRVQTLGDRKRWAQEIGFVGTAKQEKLVAGLDRVGLELRPIKSLEVDRIECLGEMEVYDIQTESGEYLSGNIRVHNCFINSVEDTMESILTLAKTEGMLFKWGSGTGTNLSVIRGSSEGLKGGGTASGPVSFMRGFDAFAGAVKSGGKTRRAAKMSILNADHPDIEDFVECKADAEKKAHALIEAGYSGAFNVPNGAYDSVFFQNANHSVRATDDFMRAVELDRDWSTVNVVDGKPAETMRARDLMHKIAQAAWVCGDPGMQFDTTANRWHTSANTDRINASNPCCITGDTLIAVADGRNAVPIRDLAGKVVDVYVWNHQTKRTVIAPMHTIEVKRQNAPVFRVTLDDGSSFRATDDHLIMLRDGSYRQVKDLQAGDSLNPFHSQVKQHAQGRTKRAVYSGTAWENEATYHADNQRSLPVAFDAHTRLHDTPVYDVPAERCCPACRQNFTATQSGQVFCGTRCRVSPLGLTMAGTENAETAQNALRVRCLKAARLLSDAGHTVNLETWDELRPVARTLGAAHVPQTETLRNLFGTDAVLAEHTALYNHKVVSVEADGCEDVYDGTVEEHHNFAIVTSQAVGIGGPNAPDFSGCFIHNSEFFFLDDTACNLASLNLMRFRNDDREFDVEAFRHAVRITVTAMEIMVGFAAYPTDKITVNSFDYRPLGLGYANLGALLMARGLPYDSDEGRAYAAALTAILSGEGYTQSAKMAARVGPFAGYEKNRQPMLRVMQMHRDHVEAIQRDVVPQNLIAAGRKAWDDALSAGREHGYRNAQISVLAPTGCLVAGSLVLTDRGLMRLDRLGDVNGKQWQNTDFRVLTDEGEKQATKFYVNGIELTRRIETRAGYAIQGTLKHRIKIVDKRSGQMEWKRFADLVPGDTVALSMGKLVGNAQTVALPPLGEEYWTGDYATRVPRTMTPDLAELIGYFMGDGSLHTKGPRFCVANADEDVAQRVKSLVKSLFNLDAHLTPQQGYVEVAVHSVPLALWWEACGFAKRLPHVDHSGKGYAPHVPDAILATNDKATYGAFLRGLYEADGTVTNGVPCWTTTQKSFSEEVKTLLLTLGLPTVTGETQTGWGNSTAYILRLRNSSYADTFRDAVGFMGSRKAAKVARAQGEQTARHDYVYLGHEMVNELIPAEHPLRNAATLAMRRHDGAVTRRTAQALFTETGDERVGRALNWFYDTIASNEDGGEQLTYDLSVPENVTYIAQGFISHNTIGFLMDCDTTGVEPDIAIVKYKSLVGGGMFKIVNQTVPEALERLGYSASERKAILDFIEQNDTIEGAPGLSDAHLPVFDCAFRAKNGTRTIHYMGHIKMMSAVQPFISGAISKTVNMPHDAVPEDIAEAYMQAWKLGIKALAIYRDGSKKTQPLSTGKTSEQGKEGQAKEAPVVVEQRPLRRRLPDERQALTHKFSVGGHEGYITIGLYPDQTPGEIFITMSKEGSVVSGLMDAFATSISLALQYGVPLRTLVEKFMHSRFEPSGFTGNPDIPMAKSIMDYLFRYIALKFLDKDERANVGLIADQQDDYDNDGVATDAFTKPVVSLASVSSAGQSGPQGSPSPIGTRKTDAAERAVFVSQADAPPCPECGSITTRNGACYRCNNCGTSIGCS